MKNKYLVSLLPVCAVAILLIVVSLFSLSSTRRLPVGAELIQEQNGAGLYKANVLEQTTANGNTHVYVTDAGKLLSVLNISSDWIPSIVLVTEKEIAILVDSSNYPGKAGVLYEVDRADGAVAYVPSKGLYFFTDPDNAYAAFGTANGSVELTNFGDEFFYTYSLNGDFSVRAMALSPDNKHIVVLSSDTSKETSDKIFARVFLIDIQNDADRQSATQVTTFTEKNQEGPFEPFLDASFVWNSDSQVTITDDDGAEHIVVLPKS